MLSALNSMAHAQQDITKMIEKAAKEGYVRVIVGLKLPAPGFKPEGILGDPQAIKQQQESIAATREMLIKSLAGLDIEIYNAWVSVPSVALKVDPCALRYLANSPYVATLHEDFADKPHKAGADSKAGEGHASQDKNPK
jgi:hypothetical protein